MENEFSKPKILIDLEEYELLKERSLDHDEIELSESLLEFIFLFRHWLGITNENYVTNKIRFKFYESLNLPQTSILEFVEKYITNQLIINEELNKQKEKK